MPPRPGSATDLVPPALPHVVHARDHPSNAIAAAVARGALMRVGRGTYLPTTDVSPRAEALARVIGTHARVATDHVFSHATAAMLHGLPLWRTPGRTHVRMAVTGGGRRDPLVVRHRGIPGDGVVDVLGLPCTDLERTTWDCLLSLPALDGLVVTDAAVRAGVSVDALLDRANRSARVRGVPRARAVLAHA
ncbi:hypothetical protein OMK64_20170, partial [Cellulomonas fimi]|nr:hypothetical protein [Cellulomonas fimi]